MNTQKLHKHLCESVVSNCISIFEQNRYADKVIHFCLKQHPKWGSKDRAFVAQHTYDMVRWFRLLSYLVQAHEIPTKGDWWAMLGALRVWQNQTLPDWNEFKSVQPYLLEKRLQSVVNLPAIRHSVADWMLELLQQELGANWEQEVNALNDQAPVYLRVNTLKINRTKLAALLTQRGIVTESVQTHSDGLKLLKRHNVFSTPEFQEGYFEVQDIASQMVAPFLEIVPGLKVIDACAGAGGKTLHIAALLQNKGKVIALDTEGYKLEELKRRSKRAGIDTIETRLWNQTSANELQKLHQFADRLLLDVPCSGMGVLRRNPDAKWKLKPDFIERMRQTQQQILSTYVRMLKPGGKVVYATCSVLPSENEKQVMLFLENNPGFSLEKMHHTYPSEGYDGFFMARLLKHSE